MEASNVRIRSPHTTNLHAGKFLYFTINKFVLFFLSLAVGSRDPRLTLALYASKSVCLEQDLDLFSRFCTTPPRYRQTHHATKSSTDCVPNWLKVLNNTTRDWRYILSRVLPYSGSGCGSGRNFGRISLFSRIREKVLCYLTLYLDWYFWSTIQNWLRTIERNRCFNWVVVELFYVCDWCEHCGGCKIKFLSGLVNVSQFFNCLLDLIV